MIQMSYFKKKQQNFDLHCQVRMLDGVYSVQEPHFWTLCSEVYIGTIKLEVASKADAKYILSQTHNIFTQVCSSLL